MDLKTFIKSLPDDDAREAFARRCGTTIGHLRNVMYGYKPCATDLAVSIERETGRRVTRQELRDDWVKHWPELAPVAASQSDIDSVVCGPTARPGSTPARRSTDRPSAHKER